jgi:2-dehydropantoate 2-reductase
MLGSDVRIAILGSGGVGGYFGGRLAEAGADIVFLARGAHLEAMRARGLRIDSPKGNLHLRRVNAESDPTAVGAVDIVFFAVKLYDTEGALALLPPLLGPRTIVIGFQNGVETIGNLSRAVGASRTAGGVSYVSAVIAEPGVIRHTAMDHLIFGMPDGSASPPLEALLDVCRRAAFQTTLSTDINVEIWTKFARLSVFSGLTAVTRCPIGVIVNDPDLLEMLRAAVRETLAVAQAKGINVPRTIDDDVTIAYKALPPQAKASMLEDLERGRRIELPWLSGAVVRLGHELGVPTPIHGFITTVLKPYVNGRS